MKRGDFTGTNRQTKTNHAMVCSGILPIKACCSYSFTTLYEYLKEYDRFFSWVLESGISNVDKMSRHSFISLLGKYV